MNSESFVLYESVYKQAALLERKLGKDVAYNFMKAIMEFGLYGILPDEEEEVWIYGLEQAITSISAAKDRYNAAVENGKKGGRPIKVNREKVIELKEQGFTNGQIAQQLVCSTSSVEKIVAEYRKNQKNLNDNEKENEKEKDKDELLQSISSTCNNLGTSSGFKF